MSLEAITDALLKSAQVGSAVCISERKRCSLSFKPLEEFSTPLVALASSIITSSDLAVQEAILLSLLDAGLQDCAIEAEEDTPLIQKFRGGPDAARIFLDPIDGTLAYSLGCPGWEEVAVNAGFHETLLAEVRRRTDPRLYGMVLGACVPREGISALCLLPEMEITYYAVNGQAFRNGDPFKYVPWIRPCNVAIGRRLLDASGVAATPFADAGLRVRWFNGSGPGVLWRIFEGDCTGYAGLNCGFDIQLTSAVAQAAGLRVSDRNGQDLVLPLSKPVNGIVFASSLEEKDEICKVLSRFP